VTGPEAEGCKRQREQRDPGRARAEDGDAGLVCNGAGDRCEQRRLVPDDHPEVDA